MKKIVSAILILAVLALSACTTVAPDVSPEPSPSPEASPSPTLAPYSSGEIVNKYDGNLSDSAAFPFIGAANTVSRYSMSQPLRLYGFVIPCTGETVSAPAYSNVARYSVPDGSSAGTFCYLARRDNMRTGEYYGDAERPWTIALLDNGGNVLGEYDDAVFASGDTNTGEFYSGYFSVLENGKWGVIDSAGETVIAPENGSDYPMYAGSGENGEPLFIKARVVQEIGERWNPRDEIYYCYVNLVNEVVIPEQPLKFLSYGMEYLGQRSAQDYMLGKLAFRQGRAAKFADGGYYGYINGSGEWAVQPVYNVGSHAYYSYVPQFYNDRCAVQRIGDLENEENTTTYVIIDENGAELIAGDTYIMNFEDIYEIYNYNSQQSTFYDRDGYVYSAPNGANVSYMRFDMFRVSRTAGVEIYRGGEPLLMYETNAPESVTAEAVTEDRIFISDYTQNARLLRLYDSDGNVLFELSDPNINYSYALYGSYLLMTKYRTVATEYGEMYVPQYGILSTDGDWILEPEYDYIEPYYEYSGGVFAVQKGRFGGLVGENGEWIVRVSLLGSLDD